MSNCKSLEVCIGSIIFLAILVTTALLYTVTSDWGEGYDESFNDYNDTIYSPKKLTVVYGTNTEHVTEINYKIHDYKYSVYGGGINRITRFDIEYYDQRGDITELKIRNPLDLEASDGHLIIYV